MKGGETKSKQTRKICTTKERRDNKIVMSQGVIAMAQSSIAIGDQQKKELKGGGKQQWAKIKEGGGHWVFWLKQGGVVFGF